MSTVRIQLRRGTSTEWATADAIGAGVILAAGEVGFVTDENTFKVGNGSAKFGNLPYILESSLGDYIPLSQFGTPSGVATLDSSGLLNVSQLPPLSKVTVASAANQAARLALTAQVGDIAIQTDSGQSYVLATSPATVNGNWQALVGSEAVVDTVEAALLAGTGLDKTYDDANGTITIDIDSTVATKTYADTAVSTHSADQTDVHGIADTALLLTTTSASTVSNKTLGTDLSANGFKIVGLATPTGNLDAATKSYVDTAISDLVEAAPATLNTLNELAAALGDDAAFSTTITNSIATKLPLAGGTMSGNLSMGGTNKVTNLPTPTNVGDATSKSYVDGQITSSATTLTTAYETYATDKAIEMADAAEAAAISTAGVAAGDAIEAHRLDTTAVHGIADTSLIAYQADINTHNLDTTNVHGIVDTAALITSTAVDTKISTAIGTEVTDRNTAISTAIGTEVNDRNTAIGTHSADTTAVHGIADTSVLATATTVATAKSEAIAAAGTAADTKVSTAVAALTKSSVGLANVDNTSDANKPVSTAAQTALDLKETVANVALKAPLDSPALTGVPTAPTAAAATNTTQVATTAYVRGEVAALVNSAGATLDTLGEIATALGNDANLSTTLTTSIALKAPIASPTFTGTVTIPAGASISGFAPLASPTFTGTNNVAALTASGLITASASGVAFTDGTQTKEGVQSRTPIIQKTASYTLSALTERDSMIEMGSASALTLTVPTNATVAWPVGTSIDILQTGAGQVTIAGAGGVTVNGTPGLKLRTQWSGVTLFKRATDTWVVYGDLTA